MKTDGGCYFSHTHQEGLSEKVLGTNQNEIKDEEKILGRRAFWVEKAASATALRQECLACFRDR